MAENLAKYKWLAPWLAAIATAVGGIVVQVWLGGASYGTLMQKQLDFEHRLSVIERSDDKQNEKLELSAKILARIETNIEYITAALREKR